MGSLLGPQEQLGYYFAPETAFDFDQYLNIVGKRDAHDHWRLLQFLMAKEADEGNGRAGGGLLLDPDLLGGHYGHNFHRIGQ